MSTQNSLLNLDFDSLEETQELGSAGLGQRLRGRMGNFDRDGETGEVIEVVSVTDRLDFFVGDRLGGGFANGGIPGTIGIGGDRAIAEVPPELEALQASIEALHESEEFAAVMAEISELRDEISQLRDMVELPPDFPNIRGLRVNISQLLESEESLVLDELRVSVEELIASGELTDGTELLASIDALDASIEALRASEEFSQVQATIEELRASGDLPENFPDGGFPGGIIRIGGDRVRGDRTREGFPDFITGELPEGIEFSDDLLNGGIGEIRSIRGDRFGGIIGELPGDGEGLADPEQLRDRIEELLESGNFEGIRGGIGRGQGRDPIFSGGLAVGLRGDRVPEGLPDVNLPGLFPEQDGSSVVV